MFIISAQEEYGLRFLLCLARQPEEQYFLSVIAEAEGVSLPYIRKIFGILRQSELVISSRGATGGYTLAKRPEEITMKEIFQALQSNERAFDCSYFSGKNGECVHTNNCSIRALIDILERKIANLMESITLAEIMQEEKSLHKLLNEKLQFMPECNSRCRQEVFKI